MRCFVEYLGHLLMHYLENGKLQLKTAYQHEEWDLPSKLSAAWSEPPSNYRDMLEDKDFVMDTRIIQRSSLFRTIPVLCRISNCTFSGIDF
jgi:hypothetical protein